MPCRRISSGRFRTSVAAGSRAGDLIQRLLRGGELARQVLQNQVEQLHFERWQGAADRLQRPRPILAVEAVTLAAGGDRRKERTEL